MTTFRPGEGEDLFSFMVQRGFFPASPSTPKFAFSIDLLELFNASQAVANADAYGMVQVFCSLAKVNTFKYSSLAFSNYFIDMFMNVGTFQ